MAGDLSAARKQIAADPKLAKFIADWQADLRFQFPGTTEVPTDDWPYLYLEHRQIPPMHFMLCISLLALFAVGLQRPRSPPIVSWLGSRRPASPCSGLASCCWKCRTSARRPWCWGTPGS
ncbi:MAG: hypothetical protein U0792_09435 [Gemmataceae bacterium]